MKCPWLQGKEIKRCAAVKGAVVVSSGELEKFCESERYKECPVYRRRMQKGKPISQRDFYSLYIQLKGSSRRASYSPTFKDASSL